jgi:hypothetical protein
VYTNHGTVGNEDENNCDSRGYCARTSYDGRWYFIKEINHHGDDGYENAAVTRPWSEYPRNTVVGYKFVIRKRPDGAGPKLELWRDMSGGEAGGQWELITDVVDDGTWGEGRSTCKQGVDPALPLTRENALIDSETGLPHISVYIRHEYATIDYRYFSIREIQDLR